MGAYCVYSVALKHCVEARLASAESLVKYLWMFAVAACKNVVAERLRNLCREYSILFEERKGIGVEHFCPFIAVISCRVSAGHYMAELRRYSCACNFGQKFQRFDGFLLVYEHFAVEGLGDIVPCLVDEPQSHLTYAVVSGLEITCVVYSLQ